VIGYASRTGTLRNRDALRRAGWRLLLSPVKGATLNPAGFRYCLDNGAWSSFSKGWPWSEERFYRAALRFGPTADFVAVPDIVEGGLESLRLSMSWLPRLDFCPLRLLPVQDGMTPADVEPHVGREIGIFIGGSDAWKERTANMWGDVKVRTGCYLHVGRVNTHRRIRICAQAGADSFDGTSATMFAKSLPGLDRVRRQLAFSRSA
jgi:hypothetical protein